MNKQSLNRTDSASSTANEVWRTLPQGQAIAGASIGIICIPGVSGLIPGNVQNATSFDFPVIYEVMEDVEFPQIAVGDPVVIPRVIAAARALVKQGAHAVVGACGSLGHYQKPVADAIREPVYMSILTQVPFILQSLGSNQKLLLVFATLGAFTDMVKDQCEIEDTDRLLAIDLVDCEEFRKLSQPNVEIRMDKLLDEVAASIENVMNDDIGAVLFQCSDLPPIAFDLQQRIGLPVFDMTGIIRWLDSCVVRKPFSGHF